MYKLTQNFAGISFMTGMAVSANKDKYKTYQFKEKPSKEEIKKIILDDYGDNTGNALKVIAKQTDKMMKIMNVIAKRDNAIIVTKKAVVTGNAKDITKLVLGAME